MSHHPVRTTAAQTPDGAIARSAGGLQRDGQRPAPPGSCERATTQRRLHDRRSQHSGHEATPIRAASFPQQPGLIVAAPGQPIVIPRQVKAWRSPGATERFRGVVIRFGRCRSRPAGRRLASEMGIGGHRRCGEQMSPSADPPDLGQQRQPGTRADSRGAEEGRRGVRLPPFAAREQLVSALHPSGVVGSCLATRAHRQVDAIAPGWSGTFRYSPGCRTTSGPG